MSKCKTITFIIRVAVIFPVKSPCWMMTRFLSLFVVALFEITNQVLQNLTFDHCMSISLNFSLENYKCIRNILNVSEYTTNVPKA